MKIIRTWGQRYLLISSNKCSGNYDITTGSNRNTISLFWDPEKSRFEMDSLTELPETALVSLPHLDFPRGISHKRRILFLPCSEIPRKKVTYPTR